jgi:hypothetical protein
MILKFDAPSFLSALNEAFEDAFLNDSPDRVVNGGTDRNMPEEQVFGLTVNRQYIVTILLEVMSPSDFAIEDTIYLDMFVARNLPKFPQYLLLSGTSLHKVLIGLCNYPGEDIADDAQLSAEYLLSVYHPTDLSALMPLFKKAGFYKVLKRIYKDDKQYANLLKTYFDDHEDQEAVFDMIGDCLRPRAGLTKRQVADVHEVVQAHAADLVGIDPVRTAKMIEAYAPSLHQSILDALRDDPEHEYTYLQTILEPPDKSADDAATTPERDFIERYMQLMCRFNPFHVADYVGIVQATNLRLEEVLPVMEESGMIDAAVVLMARDGKVREAMDRLTKHLGTLEAALTGILSHQDADVDNSRKGNAAQDLLEALQKYTNVGIWLCQGQSRTSSQRSNNLSKQKGSKTKNELLPDELLWLDFIDATVQITKHVSTSLENVKERVEAQVEPSSVVQIDTDKLLSTLRTLVQRSFTALLTSTSTPLTSGNNLSFLRILRAFLTRAAVSSPNLSDLRSVLSSIFSAYAYEERILSLANRLLEKDLFVHVHSATELRQRGWRPRGSVCERCKRRVWGPGAVGDVFARWEDRQRIEEAERAQRRAVTVGGEVERGKGKVGVEVESKARDLEQDNVKKKGKSGAVGSPATDMDEEAEQAGLASRQNSEQDLGPLVVLACRHIYHQSCLEADASGDVHDGREFRCPIDK